MRFVLSRAGLLACSVVLALCCSCEEHHPGELPDVQRDRTVAPAHPGEHAALAPTGATPSATPTPANFFPDPTPH